MGQEPRKFDAMRAQVLANMAEMLVRQLERQWALQLAEQKDMGRMMRSLSVYDMAYLFVDVGGAGSSSWRVLHMNNNAIDRLGE